MLVRVHGTEYTHTHIVALPTTTTYHCARAAGEGEEGEGEGEGEGEVVMRPVTVRWRLVTDLKVPRVGVMFVGLCSPVASAFAAHWAMHSAGVGWQDPHGVCRAPFPSSSACHACALLGTDECHRVFAPLCQLVPMLVPSQLAVSGWDTRGRSVFECVRSHHTLHPTTLNAVSPKLCALRPLRGLLYPEHATPHEMRDWDELTHTKEGEHPAAHLAQVQQDVRDFRQAHALDTVVVVIAQSHAPEEPDPAVNGTASALRAAVHASHPAVTPASVYCVAALDEGCAVVNLARTPLSPAVEMVASEVGGVVLGACGEAEHHPTTPEGVLGRRVEDQGLAVSWLSRFEFDGGKSELRAGAHSAAPDQRFNVVRAAAVADVLEDTAVTLVECGFRGMLSSKGSITLRDERSECSAIASCLLDLLSSFELLSRVHANGLDAQPVVPACCLRSELGHALLQAQLADCRRALPSERAAALLEHLVRSCVGLSGDHHVPFEQLCRVPPPVARKPAARPDPPLVISPDVWSEIFRFIPLPELALLRSVSRGWRKLVDRHLRGLSLVHYSAPSEGGTAQRFVDFVSARCTALGRLHLKGGSDGVLDFSGVLCAPGIALVSVHLERFRKARSLVGIDKMTCLTDVSVVRCRALTSIGWAAALHGLKSLNVRGCSRVSTLEPLAALPGLLRLDIGELSRVQDLAPLASLHELRWLCMERCTNVTDISPLASLRHLRSLRVSGCTRLSTVLALRGLSSLQVLEARDCVNVLDFHDTLAFGAHPLLRRVDLAWAQCLGDLRELVVGWGELESACLAACSVEDATAVLSLPCLRDADLTACKSLKRVATSPAGGRSKPAVAGEGGLRELRLAQCSALEELAVDDACAASLRLLDLGKCCALRSIPAAPALEGLLALSIAEVPLCRLDVLSRCRSLRCLDMAQVDSVTSLAPLASLGALEALNVSKCERVVDIAPLRELPCLRTLCLAGCRKVGDLSAANHRLKELTARDLPELRSLAPLSALVGLELLDVSGCPNVTDLSPLSELPRLQALDAHSCCNVGSIAELCLCPSLRVLDVAGCAAVDKQAQDAFQQRCPYTQIGRVLEMGWSWDKESAAAVV